MKKCQKDELVKLRGPQHEFKYMKSWDSVPTAGRLRLQKRNKMRKSSKNVKIFFDSCQ